MAQNIDRDMTLLSLLAQHRGKANPITAEKVAKHMTEMGHPLQPRSVGCAVRSLMLTYNIPICGINKFGYYWVITDAEIQETIRDLNSRVDALRERIAHLAKFTRSTPPNYECGECPVWLGSDNLTKDQTREMCVARGCTLVGGDNRDPE